MKQKNDPLVITGAAGFIGRHLVEHLSVDGWHLRLAVRQAANLPSAWTSAVNIDIVETGDLADCPAAKIDELLDGAAGVVHLAGLAQSRGRDEQAYHRANVEATQRLCRAAVKSQIRQFVFLSSVVAVTAHASEAAINDETLARPSNLYGASKLEAEKHVLGLAEKGILSIALRPPLVVGEKAGGNWRQLMRLAASGFPLPFAAIRNERSYCCVDSLVAAISRIVGNDWPVDRSGTYVFANPGSISLAETVGKLRFGMNRPARLFPVPSSLFKALQHIPFIGSRVAALTGSQIVDAGRFRETFDFHTADDIGAVIQKCGARYLRSGTSE